MNYFPKCDTLKTCVVSRCFLAELSSLWKDKEVSGPIGGRVFQPVIWMCFRWNCCKITSDRSGFVVVGLSSVVGCFHGISVFMAAFVQRFWKTLWRGVMNAVDDDLNFFSACLGRHSSVIYLSTRSEIPHQFLETDMVWLVADVPSPN